MEFMRGGYYARGVKRRYFEIALIASIVLLGLCVFLGVQLYHGATPDNTLRDVLLQQAMEEYEAANSAALQLSRIGGTNTWQLLAQTQQHVYAIEKLNALSNSLLNTNQKLVPDASIQALLADIAQCESLLLAGRAIDGPLAGIWTTLGEVQVALVSVY